MTHTEKTKVLHEFNFNDNVEVTLSKRGAAMLNAYNLHRMGELYAIPSIKIKLKVDYKAGDKYTQQMWCLFEMFGPGISLGAQAPFEGCRLSLISYR